MSTDQTAADQAPPLQTLPGDEVRQIMWRFAERPDLQMLVLSVRAIARGPVARLVAAGGRRFHEWTAEKNLLLNAFDDAGVTGLAIEPKHGGVTGSKNLALALAAFELAWVDGGAATCALAGHQALAPILAHGTPEQIATFMQRCLPPPPDQDRKPWRGAFCLTEPLPTADGDSATLAGKVSVAAWDEGREPELLVDKKGRFITNMGFANFVVAAVASADERIKGSCMILLEETDRGLFDRGTPTRKLGHQLSSTHDPIFRLRVPADRIVGGYTVEDGCIVPNFNHLEVVAEVFRRTRVTVGLISTAKLLSAVEPIVRFKRDRYQSGAGASAELVWQQKEDVFLRLVDVWASGEAGASLGFAAARLFDDVELAAARQGRGDQDRGAELGADPPVGPTDENALARVLSPAVKLWNTGCGATMMREAVSLMGGFGITEQCPGFLGQKWIDAQLETTYQGPEAIQRQRLSVAMTDEVFLRQFRQWIDDQRRIAGRRPDCGACTLASAMELWLWTLRHLLRATDPAGKALYGEPRQGVTFPMADALCWLLASRYQMLDLIELEEKGAGNPALRDQLPGLVQIFTDLCHVQAARAAGQLGRISAELVFGYQRHPSWKEEGGDYCYRPEDVEALEGVMPGIVAWAEARGEVLTDDGTHPPKAGPCVRFTGLETFRHLRSKLDGCMTGARLAKDRAARTLAAVRIPQALDYPA